jgi:glycosyltransferase involved in cell wall biosynthesis
MRITIITGPWLPVPALKGGSVPRMWDGLAEQFAAAGHEVIVVARRYPGQPLNELRKGVTYRRMGGASQSRSVYLDIVKDFLYAMTVLPRLSKTDILVTNDFWLPILAGRFRPNNGLIVVSANRFPKGQYRFYNRVARVIAASKAIEKAICQQTPGIAKRVRCIPNPFDTGIFVVPATGRADQSEKTILYVGRIHPEKGVDVLIRSFERVRIRHRSVRLRIVGPIAAAEGGGGEAYLARLRQLANGLPVELCKPEFDVSRLANIYREADLFCYPSMAEKGEALPVAPLEAMSTGLPVVVSNLECFLDVVKDGKTGLQFDHRASDPAITLADKLDEALSAWPRMLAIGAAAQQSVQRFGFRQVAKEFLSDFQTLVAAEAKAAEKLSVSRSETN